MRVVNVLSGGAAAAVVILTRAPAFNEFLDKDFAGIKAAIQRIGKVE